MSELLQRLRTNRTGNTSARETVKSITELKNGNILFVFSDKYQDAVWCIREVMMLLKQSGKSRVTQGQIKLGSVPWSLIYDPQG